MEIKKLVQQKLFDLGSDTVLVHSDLMQGFRIPFKNRVSFLMAHAKELFSLKDGLILWMPAFNYDFCKGFAFNVEKTPSQVGSFTEYFRKNVALWRTPVPVFSFSGIGDQPKLNVIDTIDPFGSGSAFQILYNKNAILMHYGSPINTTTFLHFAERKSKCLCYRYDKLFLGQVILNDEKKINVRFNFHVRPLGRYLDYDWSRISKQLTENNILFSYNEESTRILICKIKELIDYWADRMNEDPFYLLDQESRLWVEPLVNSLGRPFLITDFESFQDL